MFCNGVFLSDQFSCSSSSRNVRFSTFPKFLPNCGERRDILDDVSVRDDSDLENMKNTDLLIWRGSCELRRTSNFSQEFRWRSYAAKSKEAEAIYVKKNKKYVCSLRNSCSRRFFCFYRRFIYIYVKSHFLNNSCLLFCLKENESLPGACLQTYIFFFFLYEHNYLLRFCGKDRRAWLGLLFSPFE